VTRGGDTVPTVDRRDGWIAPNSNGTLSAAGFSFAATDNQGVAAYSYQMDGGPWSAAINLAGYTWSSIPSGWHTLSARAHDLVGNIGPTESFSFGVGSGVVGAARTWRNLLLTPGGSPDKTGVTYTWRPLGTGAPWSPRCRCRT